MFCFCFFRTDFSLQTLQFLLMEVQEYFFVPHSAEYPSYATACNNGICVGYQLNFVLNT